MPRQILQFVILSLIGLALFVAARRAIGSEFDERALVTLSGVGLALVTFLVTEQRRREQSRQQHTIKILFETRLSEEFRKHLDQRRAHFPLNQPVSARTFRDYRDGRGPGTAATKRSRTDSVFAAQALLNYYEFVAMGIARGDLDRDMMRRSIRGMMCNLVRDFAEVIEDEQTRNPRAWENLTRLYNDWRDKSGSYPRIGVKAYRDPLLDARQWLADRIAPN